MYIYIPYKEKIRERDYEIAIYALPSALPNVATEEDRPLYLRRKVNFF